MDHSEFESRQKSYYLSELNRAVPMTRTGSQANTISDALGIVDPQVTTAINIDPSKFVSDFHMNSKVLDADRACRSGGVPTTRNPAARTGCGWWYIPNSNLQSVGALGTRRGPMSPTLDTEYGSGQWIWDPVKAAELEGVKAASRVTRCEDMQLTGNPNMGWCPSTARAVITDGKGGPAFPRNPKGDCPGGGIITSPEECSPTWRCKGLGHPSEDGSIRLYSQDECTKLSGNWYGNGECIKAGGGSWSWDCRALNEGRGQGPAIPGQGPTPATVRGQVDVCAPLNGTISPQCLQRVTNAQCSTTGTLSQALSSGYANTSSVFNDMNGVLAERGFTIPSGIVNDGRISVQDAITAVSAIKTAATNANPRMAGAAKNLCFGSPFDACGFNPTDSKPFSASCITKVAQAAGWSPSGTGMPVNDMNHWNTLATWADVLNRVSTWKNLADIPGPDQLAYINKVYGVNGKYPDHCAPVDLGCWRDNWDRALKGPYGGRPHTKESCGAFAKQNGQNYFSVQDGNECYTGNSGYDRYGTSGPSCPPGGGPWSAHTWMIPGGGQAPASGGSIGNVKFVRLAGGSDYINLSQLVVTDVNGNNVSRGRRTTSSGVGYDGQTQFAVDGNEASRSHPQEYHSSGGNAWWQVELDAPSNIASVTVYNRSDCCLDRMASGYKVYLLGPDNSILFTSAKLSAANVQKILTVM